MDLILMRQKKEVSGENGGTGSVPANQSGSLIRNVLTLIMVVVFLLSLAGHPVSAHSAAEMGIAPDQYDKGIPVYWPYHALLMLTGFILLLSGSVVMHFGQKPGRFKIHRLLQTAGAVSVLGGLAVAVFMLGLSAAPHIRYLHDQIGVGVIVLIMLTLITGYHFNRSRVKSGTLKTHRWIGRTSIAIMVITILLGISMIVMVLAQ